MQRSLLSPQPSPGTQPGSCRTCSGGSDPARGWPEQCTQHPAHCPHPPALAPPGAPEPAPLPCSAAGVPGCGRPQEQGGIVRGCCCSGASPPPAAGPARIWALRWHRRPIPCIAFPGPSQPLRSGFDPCPSADSLGSKTSHVHFL